MKMIPTSYRSLIVGCSTSGGYGGGGGGGGGEGVSGVGTPAPSLGTDDEYN